jgi:hypothetical protein
MRQTDGHSYFWLYRLKIKQLHTKGCGRVSPHVYRADRIDTPRLQPQSGNKPFWAHQAEFV